MNQPTDTPPSARIVHGDSIEVLRAMAENSIDAVVCDPPYGLSKQPDMAEVLRHWLAGDDYKASGGGFMGKSWDSFVPGPALWREVLRVLKPGGHCIAFYGTRTYDLGVLAMRLAGFEVRDQIAWVYSTGFPKSLDVSKAIDQRLGATREVIGRRVSGRAYSTKTEDAFNGGQQECPVTAPATPEAAAWSGFGTAMKPAQEPIVLARKPLDGTVAANVLKHGVGGMNIDGCRVGDDIVATRHSRSAGADRDRWDGNQLTGEISLHAGRHPANMIHSGDDCVLDLFPGKGDQSAARFFYCAKPSRGEREAGLEAFKKSYAPRDNGFSEKVSDTKSPRANIHPTVKPIALMRYLCRLVTPPGGVVLDPFLGSGTTGCAAALEGFRFVGIEREAEYVAIAEARIAHWSREAADAQPMLPGIAAE